MDALPEANLEYTKEAEVVLDARKQLLRGYEGHAQLTPEEIEFIKVRASSEMKRNLVYPIAGLALTSFSIHTILRRITNLGPARIGMISFASATTVFALTSSYGAVQNYKDMASGLMKLQNSPIAERTRTILMAQFPTSSLLDELPGGKTFSIQTTPAQQRQAPIQPITPRPTKSVQQQTVELQKTQQIIYDTLLDMYRNQSTLTREEKDFFGGMSTTVLWRGIAMPLGLGLLSFFAMRGILRWLTQLQPRTVDVIALGWSAFSITTETFGAAQTITNQAAEGLFQLENSPKADQAFVKLQKECPDVPLLKKYPRNPQLAAAKRDPGALSDPFQTDLSKYSSPDFSFKPALVHYDSSSKETPGLTFAKEDFQNNPVVLEQDEEEQPVEYDNEEYYQDDSYEEEYQPKQTKQNRIQDERSKSFEARQRAINNYKRKQRPEEDDV